MAFQFKTLKEKEFKRTLKREKSDFLFQVLMTVFAT